MPERGVLDKSLEKSKGMLKNAFLIAFICFLIISLFMSRYLAEVRREHYRDATEDILSSVANMKAEEVNAYLRERIGDGKMLLRRNSFYDSVKRLLEDPEEKENEESLRKWLGRYLEHFQYSRILLSDTNGAILMSLPENGAKMPSALLKMLTDEQRKAKVTIGDFYRDENDGHIYLPVIVPVISDDANMPSLGTLVMLADPYLYLYPIINKWPISTKTSEALLVARDDNYVLFLNDLRFNKGAALNLRLPLDGRIGTPATKAIHGIWGATEGVDYRGQQVISYVRGIPGTEWRIVAKVDQSEASAPFQGDAFAIYSLATLAVLTFGMLLMFLWSRYSASLYRAGLDLSEKVRDSEERYRRLFESAKDGVLLIDCDTGEIFDVNPFMCELLKCPRSYMIGKKLWDLSSFRSIAASKDNYNKLQAEGYIRYENIPLEDIDGKCIDVEFVSNRYKAGGKSVIQCNVRDIGERKRAELILKREQGKARQYLDIAEVIFVAFDSQGKITLINRKGCDIIGYEEAELLGKDWFRTCLPGEEYDAVSGVFKKIMAGDIGNFEYFENSIKRKDGTRREIAWHNSVIKDDSGKIIGTLSAGEDVTERKKIQRELVLAKERQLRLLIDNIPQKVFLKDSRSNYLLCNKNFAIDFNLDPEELRGKNDFDLFPTHLAEKYRYDDRRIIESGQTENIEEEFITIKDFLNSTKTTIVNTVKVPISDGHGKFEGVLGIFWDITEKRMAERELARIQRQLEFILGATKTGLDIIDSDFNMIYIDKEWQKVYGDFHGKKCYEYFMGRNEECACCGVRKALETARPVVSEEKLEKEGGRYVQVTSIPFQDADGRWLVAEVNVDISERKKFENALIQSEEKFKTIFEDAIDGILLTRANDRTIHAANKSICSMTGYSQAEICGRHIEDLHPSKERIFVIAEYEKHAAEETRSSRDVPVLRKDGSIGYFDINSTFITIGDFKYLLGFFRDSTERKKLEDARTKAIAEIQDLYENAPCGYHSLDKDGFYVHINETELSWLGCSRDEVIRKKRFSDFTTESSAALFSREFPEFKKRGWVKGLEFAIVRKDGTIMPVLVSSVAIKNSDGEYQFSRSIMLDLTERKKNESERRRLDELQMATEIKSDFVSMVSHELRSPLGSIKEGINIVLEGLVGKINNEQKELLEVAQRNVERLHRLVNNVLDFQKISAGKMAYHFQEHDLKKLLSEVSESLRLEATKKGLRLILNIDDRIPEYVKFDADKIAQVLVNLIGNSLKFTKAGDIVLSAEMESDSVRITVHDTGMGIKADEIPELFKSFEQLSSTRNKVKGGTGLGLAISKDIVVAHKGKIWFESEEGRWTKVHFTLPVTKCGNTYGS